MKFITVFLATLLVTTSAIAAETKLSIGGGYAFTGTEALDPAEYTVGLAMQQSVHPKLTAALRLDAIKPVGDDIEYRAEVRAGTTINIRRLANAELAAGVGERFTTDAWNAFYTVNANVAVPVSNKLTVNLGEYTYRAPLMNDREVALHTYGAGVDLKTFGKQSISVDVNRNSTKTNSLKATYNIVF